MVEVINNFTLAALLLFSFHYINNKAVSIGVLFAFISYIRQFFEPINAIAEQYTTMQSALVSSDRIFEILDTNNTVENFATGAALKKLSGEIEFRDVWFAYNGENWVLRGVSFKINPGESVAFVGPTGSGKSTIISLITRF